MSINIIVIAFITGLVLVLACGTGTSSYNTAEINRLFIALEDAIADEDAEAWLDCYVDVIAPQKALREFYDFVDMGIIYDIKHTNNLKIDGSKAKCELTIETELRASGVKETKTVPISLERTDHGWKVIYLDSNII